MGVKPYQQIAIELTTQCDMECEFCDRGFYELHQGVMNFSDLEYIISDIGKHKITDSILFVGAEEPKLYKRIIDAVAMCKGAGLKVEICSNGIYLNTAKYKRLLDQGLDRLQLSLHNLSENGFKHRKVKKHISFNSYQENILNLIDINLACNTKSRIVLFVMLSKEDWLSTKMWGQGGVLYDTQNFNQLITNLVNKIERIYKKHDREIELNIQELIRAAKQLTENSVSTEINFSPTISIQLVSMQPYTHGHESMLQLGSNFLDKVELVPATSVNCRSIESPFISYDGRLNACCNAVKKEIGTDDFVIGDYSEGFSSANIPTSNNYKLLLSKLKSADDALDYCK